ncbi:hypothetical protein FQR65_LT10723 [Abscondita terminalis]|nr:hypothetical protein FQR65_LT10723 [Abscondita terminalis]
MSCSEEQGITQGICSICGVTGRSENENTNYVVEESLFNDEHDETVNQWTSGSIKMLLACYQDNLHLFHSAKKINKAVWLQVAKEINKKGYNFTGAECDLKFRNLKKTYKRIKDNNNSSGRGTITWPYFDTFDAIFGNDADVNSAFIVSSITEGEPKLSSVPSSRKHLSTVATSSSRCTPAEVERASSSCTETAPHSNVEDTSRFSKLPKKRKTTTSAEPEWVKKAREEDAARHTEKMGV